MAKTISQAAADKHDLLFPILISLFTEVKELSKKKQDGILNEMKVKMINKVLGNIKELLKDDPTTEFLELLDIVDLPSNSDAVLIIAQFNAAMEQFKGRYFGYSGSVGREIWKTSQ